MSKKEAMIDSIEMYIEMLQSCVNDLKDDIGFDNPQIDLLTRIGLGSYFDEEVK